MNSHKTKNFFRVSAEDFKKIPGSPVAYWISHNLFDMLKGSLLSTHFKSGGRFKTCDDELFLRMWWEVSIFRRKWHPFFKGGDGRKYYGNEDRVINWSAEAQNFYYHNGGIGNKEFPLFALPVSSNSVVFTLLAVFLFVNTVMYSSSVIPSIATISSSFRFIAFTPEPLTPTKGTSTLLNLQ